MPVLEKLKNYHLELLKWTRKMNLISAGSIENADIIHIADAIQGIRIIQSETSGCQEIWDFGSGNGIPGAVYAILDPEQKIHCVDSDQRKISFIKNVALTQGIQNLETYCCRVEDLEKNTVNVAMARGFAPIEKSLEITEALFQQKGTFFHFKGPDWKNEVSGPNSEKCSTWNISELSQYELPENKGKRTVVIATRHNLG